MFKNSNHRYFEMLLGVHTCWLEPLVPLLRYQMFLIFVSHMSCHFSWIIRCCTALHCRCAAQSNLHRRVACAAVTTDHTNGHKRSHDMLWRHIRHITLLVATMKVMNTIMAQHRHFNKSGGQAGPVSHEVSSWAGRPEVISQMQAFSEATEF